MNTIDSAPDRDSSEENTDDRPVTTVPGVGRSRVSGERGAPTGKKTRKKANLNKLVVAVVVVIALAAVVVGIALFAKRLQDQRAEAKAAARAAPKAMSGDREHNFAADAERLKRERAAAAAQASMAAATAAQTRSIPVPSGAAGAIPVQSVGGGGLTAQGAGAPTGTPGAQGTQGNTGPHVETVAERRLDGDVLLPQSDKSSTGGASKPDNRVSPGVARAVQGGLDERLTPSTLASVKASFLPDLDYLLKRGTMIPCVQKTSIVTTYPGMASCTVTQDVYSANGRTLLIERDSEVIGEQRTSLMQGQARIFVLWSHVDMPSGATIELDSPGTDALGATGIAAYVDNHFWDRFGGAMMVSLIGDFGQALSNRSLGSGNNQIQFSNTSSAGQNLADDTLKNTINIPPTAYSNTGSELNIFVARNVDFRSVYDLEQQP